MAEHVGAMYRNICTDDLDNVTLYHSHAMHTQANSGT